MKNRVSTTITSEQEQDILADVTALRAKITAINTITTPVSDARASAGNDRLDADLEFLHYLKFTSRSGTPGAQEVHDDLSASYPAGRRSSAEGNPPA